VWSGLGSFAPGDSVTLHVTATVDARATGTMTNRVTVAPPTGFPDRNPGNDLAIDTDRLTPRADLTIVKELTTALGDGQEAVYDIAVTNHGPSAATKVVVRDDLPDTLTAVAASGDGWTCTVDPSVVTCTLDSVLEPDASARFQVTAVVHATGGTSVTNTAIVSSLTPGLGGHPVTAVDRAHGQVISALPASGADSLDLLRTAAMLLLTGGGLLLLRRRRRTA
jgi:uncharacterized repeat protein (TIGR01451 family)/LPXTG-motif cell wall-anchored protein